MAVRCLTGSRFTMRAEVLRWEGVTEGGEDDVSQGEWQSSQDPITGEILNVWVPGTPATPSAPASQVRTIDCIARGIVDGGVRLSGFTESFGDRYENEEYVRLWVTPRTNLTRRDRITNIREKRGGRVIWNDEAGSPTIFDVVGISPLFDAFNKHNQTMVLLKRIDR